MSTLRLTNLQNASAASPAFVLAADGSATANLSSVNGGPIAGSRNRIINGDMRIDQRNAGASVTVNSSARTYGVDRFFGFGVSSAGVFTQQQSTDVPTGSGFTNSVKLTTTTSVTPGSSDTYGFAQAIEGNNVADLMFGSASAKTVTLSFWVKSSLTGTFTVVIANYGGSRTYPATFSISAANTWEQKAITIAGDTTGTWLGSTSEGITLLWMLGSGSTLNGTANTWAATKFGVSGQTNLISTNGATFYITGVQLEPGSTATPFERRSYGQELALCQRYYAKTFDQAIASAQNTGNYNGALTNLTGSSAFTGNAIVNWRYPVRMRSIPTILLYTPGTNTSFTGCFTDSGGSYVAATATNIGETACIIYSSGGAANVNSYAHIQAAASIEL